MSLEFVAHTKEVQKELGYFRNPTVSHKKNDDSKFTVTRAEKITLVFQFKRLSALQIGELYGYMIIDLTMT